MIFNWYLIDKYLPRLVVKNILFLIDEFYLLLPFSISYCQILLFLLYKRFN